MVKIASYMMRVALMIMLFQFSAPAFLPSCIQQVSNSKATTVHTPHCSIIAPQLLKEKDEKGDEKHLSVPALAELLDFADHSLHLTATHEGKTNHFHTEQSYDLRPPIFTRLHTLLL